MSLCWKNIGDQDPERMVLQELEEEGWDYWVEVEVVVRMEVAETEALYNPLRLLLILQSEEEMVMPNSTARTRPKLADCYCICVVIIVSHNIFQLKTTENYESQINAMQSIYIHSLIYD